MSDEEEGNGEVLVPLWGMLEMVAFKRGLRDIRADMWIQGMYGKLGDIGIHTLREFLESLLTINERLVENGHRQVEAQTLNLMIAEVCDMMFGPVLEIDVEEAGQDRHRE